MWNPELNADGHWRFCGTKPKFKRINYADQEAAYKKLIWNFWEQGYVMNTVPFHHLVTL